MKLLHLADLHIGKRVNGFSMLEDQAYILDRIISIAAEREPDAVLIAGDVYDRAVPSEEAIELFDSFLVRLSELSLPVMVISGNHDSAERIAFGGRLMDSRGIYLSPVYRGEIEPIVLNDEHGAVAFWLIPFLKPSQVRRWFPDAEIASYEDAMRAVIDSLPIDHEMRNVAVAHQFITGGATCDSEEHSVGGTDEISTDVFEKFDYTAFGHLHGAQRITRDNIRYSGSPLKYSFSEARHNKSVAVVELDGKGFRSVELVPLTAKRDMLRLSGAFSELTESGLVSDDYYEITLTDEQDVPNALARLRSCYPNIMLLKYDNTRTRAQSQSVINIRSEKRSPLELFDELYEKQNGQPMDSEQSEYLQSVIEQIWEGAE